MFKQKIVERVDSNDILPLFIKFIKNKGSCVVSYAEIEKFYEQKIRMKCPHCKDGRCETRPDNQYLGPRQYKCVYCNGTAFLEKTIGEVVKNQLHFRYL